MKFDETYFIGGNESNYTDYRKKKFDKQAEELISTLGLTSISRVIDYGCATGGLLNGLQERGIKDIEGTDISDWAIEFGKKRYPKLELQHYNRNLLTLSDTDWLIMLDVLEHMDDDELRRIIFLLHKHPIHRGIVIRIPVSKTNGGQYVLDISENDKTHIQRKTRDTWIEIFEKIGYTFEPLNLVTIYDTGGVLAGVLKYDSTN